MLKWSVLCLSILFTPSVRTFAHAIAVRHCGAIQTAHNHSAALRVMYMPQLGPGQLLSL
jgi:hypothetical protein